jgi:serine/threonine-protein kinase
MRADAAAKPPAEGTRQVTAGAASQSASTSQWQEKTLNIVERQLASFIGPLAKIMVKRAAHNTTSIHELYEALASKLDTEPERRAFLARKAELGVEAGPQTAPSATSPGTSFGVGAAVAQIPVSQALIDKAIAALVRSQGPIARVLAQRAAKTAPNPAAFVDALAAALSDPADRAAFLRDLGPLDN